MLLLCGTCHLRPVQDLRHIHACAATSKDGDAQPSAGCALGSACASWPDGVPAAAERAPSRQGGCSGCPAQRAASPQPAPPPLRRRPAAETMGLSEALLKAIKRKGFRLPTPIQRKTMPLILQGMDVVGMARTGSGKTAAFVIPMVERCALFEKAAQCGCPTRLIANIGKGGQAWTVVALRTQLPYRLRPQAEGTLAQGGGARRHPVTHPRAGAADAQGGEGAGSLHRPAPRGCVAGAALLAGPWWPG